MNHKRHTLKKIIGFSSVITPAMVCAQEKNVEEDFCINVKMCGAKGDGSDASEAIRRAWDIATKKNVGENDGFFNTSKSMLYFPAGVYRFDGKGLFSEAGLAISIFGDGPGLTKIILNENYFVDHGAHVDSFCLRGIYFASGKGVVNFRRREQNVRGMVFVEDNIFYGYTECAIKSSSEDFPYLKIRDNIFLGERGRSSIGIDIGGDTSMCEVVSNAFLRNKYHLKISPPGNNLRVMSNDFIRFPGSVGNGADIWMVPSSVINNAYNGTVVSDNKFGIENRAKNDRVVLIADDLRGECSENKSSGYVCGFVFRNNYVAIADGGECIKSHTPNVIGCVFDIGLFGGYGNSRLIDVPEGEGAAPGRNSLSFWGGVYSNRQRNKYPVSPGFGVVSDPYGCYQHSSLSNSFWMAGEALEYLSLFASREPLSARNAAVKFDDEIGVIDFSEKGSVEFKLGKIDVNRSGFIELDLFPVNDKVNDGFEVDIYSPSGGVVFSRSLGLPDFAKRFRFLFSVSKSFGDEVLRINSRSSEKSKIRFGRMDVYHSSEPINHASQNIEKRFFMEKGSVKAGGCVFFDFFIGGFVSQKDFCMASFDGDYSNAVSIDARVVEEGLVRVFLRNNSSVSSDYDAGYFRVRVYKSY